MNPPFFGMNGTFIFCNAKLGDEIEAKNNLFMAIYYFTPAGL